MQALLPSLCAYFYLNFIHLHAEWHSTPIGENIWGEIGFLAGLFRCCLVYLL
jgi:hypothetical protein